MITKMQKYTFLIQSSRYEEFLNTLQEAGVVHVTTKAVGALNDEDLQSKVDQADAIRHLLKQGCPDQMVKEEADIRAQMDMVQTEARRVAPWGDFDAQVLENLKAAGKELHFYTCSSKRFDAAWGIVVTELSGITYFASITPIDNEAVTEVKLVKSSAALQADREGLNGLLVAAKARKEAWLLANKAQLEADLAALETAIDVRQVTLSGVDEAEGTLKLLEGYCPEEKCEALNAQLETTPCYFEAEQPTLEDAATTPIILKNNFFSRLFEPFTRMYSLPNYTEIDLTCFLAPFYTLFFGLCLGDGGYGVLIMAVAIFLLIKKPEMKNLAWMAFFLGLSTAVVGLVTGVFFGINLENVAFLAPIKQYFVTDANFKAALGGYSPMMVFSIFIGIVQILCAMAIKAAKLWMQRGFKYSLQTLGWLIFLIAGIVLLAGTWSQTAKYVIYGVMIVAGYFILFWGNPERKFKVLNLGGGLYGVYNMVSGLLGDVLSYIRLFALGLAGGILGSVFNQLAMQVGSSMNPWIGWLPMIVIMVFGHTLNFALSGISAIVHPLRLTFVEFYKNAGFEGGGVEYHPFKK